MWTTIIWGRLLHIKQLYKSIRTLEKLELSLSSARIKPHNRRKHTCNFIVKANNIRSDYFKRLCICSFYAFPSLLIVLLVRLTLLLLLLLIISLPLYFLSFVFLFLLFFSIFFYCDFPFYLYCRRPRHYSAISVDI